jgi:hypothetical protein
VAACIVLAGCQEKLTSPGDCPALCPGGQPQVFDEVLSPIVGADSSFMGYVRPQAAQALLVSNGLRGFEERAVMRFASRADSISVRDTLRAYTIDSVSLGFNMVARDTMVGGLQLLVYRLPPFIDSTTSYAALDPAFVPENLVTAVPIPDSVKSGALRTVLQAADLARVALSPADSGVLSLGVRLDAPSFTGVRLGSSTVGSGGVFVTYATVDIPDTGTARLRNFPQLSTFNTTLPAVPEVVDSTLLTVGGAPSSRSLIRFELPPRIRDSATVVRATLELTPVSPIGGLPTDPARLIARGVLADLGAKSPVESRFGVGLDSIPAGTSGVVEIEMVRLLQQVWLGSSRPPALVLSLTPELEAASFTRPVFYSSRAADPPRSGPGFALVTCSRFRSRIPEWVARSCSSFWPLCLGRSGPNRPSSECAVLDSPAEDWGPTPLARAERSGCSTQNPA